MTTVLNFGGHAVGHVQHPVNQSNTTPQALVKHKRQIEDSMISKGLDTQLTVSLDFVKPADASQNDKRRGLQLATAAAADSGRLLWNVPTIISPLPLIKMIDMLGFEDSKPGPSARAEQKGVGAHTKILSAYLTGVNWEIDQSLVVLDLVPNRQCEFARAIMDRLLAGNQHPKIKFFLVLRPDQKDVLHQLEQQVYSHWDNSSTAPPKQRERSRQEQPQLQVFCWAGGAPQMPEAVLKKFPQGTPQHQEVLKMEAELRALWPAAAAPTSDSRSNAPRVSAMPDLAGAKFVDLSRAVSLPKIDVAGFNVYLGNLTNEELKLEPLDLFGFNTGQWEMKIIKGRVIGKHV
ncbi:FO synthase subunit 1, partial [Durusdinium trenchii]